MKRPTPRVPHLGKADICRERNDSAQASSGYETADDESETTTISRVRPSCLKHFAKPATLTIATQKQGAIDFTSEATRWVDEAHMTEVLLNLLCRHTSASLVVQEMPLRL